ncbi:MAG TPA: hypothetical protein VF916_11790 [Ktedonobacterales bacterium]
MIVKLGGGGAVDIYSNVGTCNVIPDVTGHVAYAMYPAQSDGGAPLPG